MPVRPCELLQLAQELTETGDSEAKYRASASRAYYGAYHSCLVHEQDLPPTPLSDGDRGVHSQLISLFTNHSVKKNTERNDWQIKKVGYLLKNAHVNRCQADYYLDTDFDQKAAQETIGFSEKIIEEVQKIKF